MCRPKLKKYFSCDILRYDRDVAGCAFYAIFLGITVRKQYITYILFLTIRRGSSVVEQSPEERRVGCSIHPRGTK